MQHHEETSYSFCNFVYLALKCNYITLWNSQVLLQQQQLTTCLCFQMFIFWMAKTLSGQYIWTVIINLLKKCQPYEASQMKFTSFSRTTHWLIVHVKQWSCFVWETRIHCHRRVAANSLDAKPVDYCIWGVMQELSLPHTMQDVADLLQRLMSTE